MKIATVYALLAILFMSVVGDCAESKNNMSRMIPSFLKPSLNRLEKELIQKHGGEHAERIKIGIQQVALFWRKEDGDAKAFESFVRDNFISDKNRLNEIFKRLERKFEALDGYMAEIVYELRREMDLDTGEILPLDEIFGSYDPAAHVAEDCFKNKVAFIVLLNFPIATFEERDREGAGWSRQRWAEIRLAQRFSKRVPADVSQKITAACSEGELYTSEYKIWMHHVLGPNNQRLFPKGLKLISHWNLRDEIKAQYGLTDGLMRQQTIQKVMERIINQTIPQAVINNPLYDWNPFTNEVSPTDSFDYDASREHFIAHGDVRKSEGDRRYDVLLNIFKAIKQSDKYYPFAPTFIQRKFQEERQISEVEVETMLDDLLSSRLLKEVALLIERRVGRPLEPFDIWYNGFTTQASLDERQIDLITSKKYPTAETFKNDIPRILANLGFSNEQSEFLAKNIDVEASRGTGHAMGHAKRGFPARLRTRVERNGMNYKGFNIAMHEFGHNVEQVFSLNKVDCIFLAGVPNNACTEAIAYLFQDRDLKVLGLSRTNNFASEFAAIQTYWTTCEIAAVALVEIKIWKWLYSHPDANSHELKTAALKIAKDVWNKYYADVIGKKDVELLAIYSHMFFTPLYLADYPVGHLISYQIEEKLKNVDSFGGEIEKIASFGNLTPNLWMINATGKPISVKPLLSATEKAILSIKNIK
ncbi:MAG: hypothetical protein N2487_03620 [Verrucomicrobiae bacterium]|nr:hypothetical protein [Verrucomicrobiae bacterium]